MGKDTRTVQAGQRPTPVPIPGGLFTDPRVSAEAVRYYGICQTHMSFGFMDGEHLVEFLEAVGLTDKELGQELLEAGWFVAQGDTVWIETDPERWPL